MADSLPAESTAAENEASCSAVRRAKDLVSLFHHEAEGFAGLQGVAASDAPEPYAGLLVHNSHMTVAMERFYGGPVRLRVVAELTAGGVPFGGSYAREILLANGDGRVVQYGIVRIDLSVLPAASREAILGKGDPLGRILIASGMHRDVHEVELLEVTPGPAFGQLMQASAVTYGRVAEIRLDGRPAVELLEVVPSFAG